MAHASLQVCMDTSDWLQGTMSEEISTGLDSSLSSPTGGTASECMLAAACSSRAGAPLMERRLRPPHDQNLKCPRCDSTHTKFCYYNNYSLSQPRYFCKTCRRYWTKGGTLRNIPVGGGCRKSNKKSSSKKPNNCDLHQHQHQHQHQDHHQPGLFSQGSAGGPGLGSSFHGSIPEMQFSPHLASLIGAQMSIGGGGGFMEGGGLLRPIDFMESKYEGLVGGGLNRGFDFIGGSNNINGGHEFGILGVGDHHLGNNNGGYNGLNSTFGGINISSSNNNSPLFNLSNSHDQHHHHIHEGNLGISFMDQRLLLPYDGNDENNSHQNGVDVKPNPKLLSLERQDLGCNSNVGKNNSSYGYNNVTDTLGSWTSMMGNFQSSATNSLM
ncbi:hypothetical protein RND81_10G228400 [Saponaria officinalis]|uniref:Dof zinc finger protein n=1 Tax=Saponaria officinalis TaxID=3572 RepID=A0AAW1I7L0_SAPOF